MSRPCLNATLLDFMDRELDRVEDARVLEIGGGYSTAWFRDRALEVVTLEDDEQWAERIGVEPRQWWQAMPHLVSTGESFDLVLVDGVGDRDSCAELGWTLVKRGGVLIYDDAQRSRLASCVFGGTEFPPDDRDVEEAHKAGRIAKVWRKV